MLGSPIGGHEVKVETHRLKIGKPEQLSQNVTIHELRSAIHTAAGYILAHNQAEDGGMIIEVQTLYPGHIDRIHNGLTDAEYVVTRVSEQEGTLDAVSGESQS